MVGVEGEAGRLSLALGVRWAFSTCVGIKYVPVLLFHNKKRLLFHSACAKRLFCVCDAMVLDSPKR